MQSYDYNILYFDVQALTRGACNPGKDGDIARAPCVDRSHPYIRLQIDLSANTQRSCPGVWIGARSTGLIVKTAKRAAKSGEAAGTLSKPCGGAQLVGSRGLSLHGSCLF